MLPRARRCSPPKSAHSFHMRPIVHRPQLFPLNRVTLPRPFGRNASRSFHSARNKVKSRGLHLCRSTCAPPISLATSFSPCSLQYLPQQRHFSSTPPTMTATKIDGTAIAKKIREKLRAEIVHIQKTNPRYKPSLKIIQGNSGLLLRQMYTLTGGFTVGDRSDSSMSITYSSMHRLCC